MNRKSFIRDCGITCLGMTALGVSLEGCGTSRSVQGDLTDKGLCVPMSAFRYEKKDQVKYRSYVVVHHENLQYPVCIYRFNETSYTALWMQCTHQGAELQVFGDRLQCPAHGSEFTNRGAVQNGPADTSLRTFTVTIEKEHLKIALI